MQKCAEFLYKNIKTILGAENRTVCAQFTVS